MAIFGTYLRAGRGSEPVWFRGPKTLPKILVIYGATSGGPNSNCKLIMTLEKACHPPLKLFKDGPLSVLVLILTLCRPLFRNFLILVCRNSQNFTVLGPVWPCFDSKMTYW